jgi:HEAT repeat protein
MVSKRFQASALTLALVCAFSFSAVWAQETAPAAAPATSAPATGVTAAPGAEALADNWANLLHYIKLARPDLAKSYAQAILDAKAPAKDIYMQSVQTPDSQTVLAKGARLEGMKEPIAKLLKVVAEGYQSERADPEEIKRSIEMLTESTRAFAIGEERLAVSGEFALPQLIQKLAMPGNDAKTIAVRERILRVLPKLGKEAVRGLSEALQTSDPRLQEDLAMVLGEIKYPQAAPALKELSTRKGVLDRAAKVAVEALTVVAGADAIKQSLAQIDNEWAGKYYYCNQNESLLPDERSESANVWYWKEGLGLVYKPVPRQILCDVYAMRLARLALAADPSFSAAVPLWLSADIKRKADLPEGAVDPTRPDDQPSPSFYALASSPKYLQIVLSTAIKDGNTPVALSAVQALAKTATAQSLIGPGEGGAQPLVDALTYHDRTVQFNAAVALALAMPQQKFTADELVITVLNNALRQTGKKTALVIASVEATRNALKDAVRAAGFEVIDAADSSAALAAARASAGVDIAVVGDVPAPSETIATLRRDPALAALPIVIVAAENQKLRTLVKSDGKSVMAADAKTVGPAIEDAGKLAGGKAMTPEDSAQWAIQAAGALRLVGLTNSPVYDAKRSVAALSAALNDERSPVRVAAAKALAVLSPADAQQALATLALSTAPEDVRIEAFGALSESLRRFGNKLKPEQCDAVLKVVNGKDSQPLREAAAQALGAMNLSSDKVKDLIVSAIEKSD